MIRLREMTEAEYGEYKQFLIEDYGRDISRYYDLPIEAAQAASSRSIESLLSQGMATPKQFLYIIVRSENGEEAPLGYLWLEIDVDERRCFINDIYIHEAYRGQGWGRMTLELVEAEIAAQGIDRIGLNVFHRNTAARELYTRMGYEIVSMNMQKRLQGW